MHSLFSKNQALIHNAGLGKLDEVIQLLKDGANVHANNDAALHSAAFEGFYEVVVTLVNNGADINSSNALLQSATQGHYKIVIFLINRGVDVNTIDNYGGTALLYSSIRGHLDVMKILLNNKAFIHMDESDAFTAAIKNQQYEAVKLLIKYGADVEVTDEEALQYTIAYAPMYLVKKIIPIDDNTLCTSLNYERTEVIDYILSFYLSKDLLKTLKNKRMSDKVLKFIMSKDLLKYKKVVNVYKKMGISVK